MQRREAAFFFILILLFIDMLGIGMIIPVLPDLIRDLAGGDVGTGARMFGWFIAIFAAMQFLFSPLLGALSDRYGRRPVILVSTAGMAVDYLIMTFAPTLALLFVGRVLSGICSANLATANAYIADVTPPEERAKRYGMIGGAFGFGFVAGPALGGLLGHFDARAPFLAAAVLSMLSFLYGAFVLPESHKPENRRPFSIWRANPFSSLAALTSQPVVALLGVTLLFINLAAFMGHSVWVIYTEYKFHWTTSDVGWSLAAVGVLVWAFQSGGTALFSKKLGEWRALYLALACAAVSSVLYGAATAGWMMYCVLLIGCFSSMCGPLVQTVVSKQVAPTEQGSVQGALAAINSIAAVASPLGATWLFEHFTRESIQPKIPGVPFYTSAILSCIALFIATRTHRVLQRSHALAPETGEIPQPSSINEVEMPTLTLEH